jgi:hypothetical protein
MTEEDRKKIMWKGWKKEECRSRLFGIGPKEEEILIDNAEDGIHRSRNTLILEFEEKRKNIHFLYGIQIKTILFSPNSPWLTEENLQDIPVRMDKRSRHSSSG